MAQNGSVVQIKVRLSTMIQYSGHGAWIRKRLLSSYFWFLALTLHVTDDKWVNVRSPT